MASSSSSFALILLSCLILAISQVQAQTAPAPGPAGPINLTSILEKNGQYTTFIRLLKVTQVGNQIENQLNSSDQGMTVLAPTDNAFNNLKSGTLNDLTVQEQVALVLYHVLPKYYSLASLQTVSNPVRTQATGQGGGQYDLNITSSANQVNVSTGVVDSQLNNALRQDFPLAVYQLDKVLLPLDLFGTKTPKPSPTPLASPAKKAPSSAAKGPSTADASGSNTRSLGWGLVIGMCLMCMSFL